MTFVGPDVARPIFWKEATIALEAIFSTIATVSQAEHVEIRIAVDNTAASSALKRCYTPDIELSERLVDLEKMLNAKLIIISVKTEDQAADEPSRERAISLERCQRCWWLL